MPTLAERIQGLRGGVVDASKSLTERVSGGVSKALSLGDRVRTFQKDLALSSIKQTGKGLGIMRDGIGALTAVDPETAEEQGLIDLGNGKYLDAMGAAGGIKRVGANAANIAAKAAPGVFEGFQDLSTKLLEKLKGRSTVSKQFISDATNAPDLKQTEKDVIRRVLEDEGDQIDVPTFAEKVKAELLPLSVKEPKNISEYRGAGGRYESVNLPDELRGPVANYREKVYESPVKTSAGEVHFSSARDTPENYFGHTRVEDLPDNGTRRVIEVQSDLFQKGRLEGENDAYRRSLQVTDPASIAQDKAIAEAYKIDDTRARQMAITKANRDFAEAAERANEPNKLARQAEVAKLEPYKNNAAHFRMIREEVKQAALDGKTKLQFPTGETAMKIEGLGDTNTFTWKDAPLRAEMLKVGREVNQGANRGNEWVITEVLDNGKFKAIQKDRLIPEGAVADKSLINSDGYGLIDGDVYIRSQAETFDISGKVDEKSPIFRFYQKEVGAYLKNKYNGHMVTDDRGVTWWEIDVDPKKANEPVLAFGKANAGFLVGASAASVVGIDMMSRTMGIESEWANNLAEEVKTSFPFDEQALKDIEQLNYRQVNWSGKVGGSYSMRGSEIYEIARKFIGEKLAHKLSKTKGGQKDSPTIKIDKDLKRPVEEIMAHEMLHRVFDQRFTDEQETEVFAKDFYETWNGLMKDETFNEQDFQKMEDVDRHISGGKVYKDLDDFSLANERYAYLGTLAVEEGIEAIPEPLRRFYVGIIKDYSLNEDGTPSKKSRKMKEF